MTERIAHESLRFLDVSAVRAEIKAVEEWRATGDFEFIRSFTDGHKHPGPLCPIGALGCKNHSSVQCTLSFLCAGFSRPVRANGALWLSHQGGRKLKDKCSRP